MQRQPLASYEFWFVVGSQFLYGKETLDQVADHAKLMVLRMNASDCFPQVGLQSNGKNPEKSTMCQGCKL